MTQSQIKKHMLAHGAAGLIKLAQTELAKVVCHAPGTANGQFGAYTKYTKGINEAMELMIAASNVIHEVKQISDAEEADDNGQCLGEPVKKADQALQNAGYYRPRILWAEGNKLVYRYPDGKAVWCGEERLGTTLRELQDIDMQIP